VRLWQRTAAELVGTALLLAIVVGSGIMGERLADGNVAIALLANSLATGFGLFVLIVTFAPVSGAHFNPLVTLTSLAAREMRVADALCFIAAQIAGAVLGVMIANAMFDLAPIVLATKSRTGAPLWLGEMVATFGLLLTILATSRRGNAVTAAAVGAFITAGYWFTSSTSFANPVVSFARALTPTFTGISLVDVPGFIVAQCIGAVLGVLFFRRVMTPR